MLPAIFDRLERSSDYRRRRARVSRWNAAHPIIKRGLALTPVKFGISFTSTMFNQAGRAAAGLYGRHGAAESRRHGDGPGSAREGGAGRRHRVGPAAVGHSHLRDRHQQGTEYLRHRRLFGLRSQRQGGASGGGRRSGERLADLAGALHGVAPRGRPLRRRPRARRRAASAVCRLARAAHEARVSLSATGFYRTPKIHWNKQTQVRHGPSIILPSAPRSPKWRWIR